MELTRRGFVQAGALTSLAFVGAAAAAETPSAPTGKVKYRIGAMDGILGVGGGASLAAAKRAGLEGVEPDAGGAEATLRICKPEVIAEYKKASEQTGVAVCSICMGLLNGSPLVRDARAPGWVSATIDAAAALGAKAILIACFGDGTLKTQDDRDKAAAILKDLAPKAAAKGVTLCLESTLNAKEHLALLEKAGNPAGLKIYYDVGNATHYGYDVPAELRLLAARIFQIHFKDYKNSVLGKGEVKFAAIAEAIAEVNYDGWIVLETGAPLGPEITAAANAGFIRGLFVKYV